MTAKQKRNLARIIISALTAAVLLLVDPRGVWRFLLWMIPYLLVGYDILWDALRGLFNGRLLDENFLMAVATVGAVALAVWGRGDYVEAVAVMLFYQIGELFQGYALNKSRRTIGALMDIRPDYANIEKNGEIIRVSPDEVEVGSVIVVNPGERVAIDGVIVEGESEIDVSALTGESAPSSVSVGDEVLSASVNTSSPIKIRTTKAAGESAAARILELVENASASKSRPEKFITRFAKVYTPAVCAAALCLALFPPLLKMAFGGAPDFAEWIYRALSFLVVSCPCALVISIPMGFFACLGGAGRKGILIKGSNYIEALSKVKCVAFDKTGTITNGSFEVVKILPSDMEKDELLEYAALAESASSHPIASSLCRAYGKPVDRSRVDNIREIRGRGVCALIDGKEVAVGNGKLVEIPDGAESLNGAVYISVEGKYAGCIVISDTPKAQAAEAVAELEKAGVSRTVMLTGDTKEVGEAIAREVGIKECFCSLLPEDKVSELEKLISENKNKGGNVAFAGDGINDAPVLARADVGIAMGGIGSDAAMEAADVVIMDDNPAKIADAIRISARCMRISKQNIVFSVGIKLLCLVLVAVGIAGMDLAIFADVGVMVLAALNAMRCLKG